MAEREGFRQVTAYLCVRGAADAIEFYRRAFGAVERYRMANADGTLGHAEVTIGGTVLMLSDEAPELGVVSPLTQQGRSVAFVLDVDDVDSAWERALAAGAAVDRPLKDQPYGRGGWVIDPFGHHWSLITPNPDFDPVAMAAGAVG